MIPQQRPQTQPFDEPKVSWWGLKGETLVLLSSTPGFCTFIQCRPEEVVQALKITDLFLPTVHQSLSLLLQRAYVSSGVEVGDFQILTRTGVKKRVKCSIHSLNQPIQPGMDASHQKLFEIGFTEWTHCFPLLHPLSPTMTSKMEVDDDHETLQQKLLHTRGAEAPEVMGSGVRARMSVMSLLN